MRAPVLFFVFLALYACGAGSSPREAATAGRKSPGPEDLRLEAMADTWKGPTRTNKVEAIIRLAKEGDASAQFALGNLYRKGDEGVPKDLKKALDSYLAAAEKGHPGAHFNVGAMYGNGEGVPADDAEAMRWIRMAAEKGHPMAKKMIEQSASKESDRDG